MADFLGESPKYPILTRQLKLIEIEKNIMLKNIL